VRRRAGRNLWLQAEESMADRLGIHASQKNIFGLPAHAPPPRKIAIKNAPKGVFQRRKNCQAGI
jgi:hypothetical protein